MRHENGKNNPEAAAPEVPEVCLQFRNMWDDVHQQLTDSEIETDDIQIVIHIKKNLQLHAARCSGCRAEFKRKAEAARKFFGG